MEEKINEIEDTVRKSNVCLAEVSEGEGEREWNRSNIWRDNGWEFSRIDETNQSSGSKAKWEIPTGNKILKEPGTG